jgi:hypothetical protein
MYLLNAPSLLRIDLKHLPPAHLLYRSQMMIPIFIFFSIATPGEKEILRQIVFRIIFKTVRLMLMGRVKSERKKAGFRISRPDGKFWDASALICSILILRL